MSKNVTQSFDEKTFLANFAGIEDLARETVNSFLNTVDSQMSSIESAIQKKDSKQIEISAHTLKGSVSNFYAEACRQIAFKIEQFGHGKTYSEVEIKGCFEQLKTEIVRLKSDLKFFLNKAS